MCGDLCMILGDLNAKISEDGTVMAKSPNGNLLLNIAEEQHLKFVNFSSKCSGKWTLLGTQVVLAKTRATRHDMVSRFFA